MQGSNDLPLLPFGGSLHRKASQTTYGRRGRATLAAKDGSKADRAGKREKEEDDSIPDQESDQLLADKGMNNGNGELVNGDRFRSSRQTSKQNDSGKYKRKDAVEVAETAGGTGTIGTPPGEQYARRLQFLIRY
jgi:hypothetical protein